MRVPLWRNQRLPLWKRIVLRSAEREGRYDPSRENQVLPYVYWSSEELEDFLFRDGHLNNVL